MQRTGRFRTIFLAAIGLVVAPAHATSRTLPEAPATSRAPSRVADGDETCTSALRVASESEHLEEKPSNALFGAVGHAIAVDASCKDRIGTWLTTASCTQVYGVVAAAAVAAETWEATRTAELLTTTTARGEPSCLHAMLLAVQGASAIDEGLATAVLRTTEGRDAVTTDGAWMVVGTVGLAARVRGQPAVASTLEGRIAAELSRRMRAGRDVSALLEAAGNAGCRTCSADIGRAMTSKDARTRRIAVGALRFSETEGAAATACKVLHDEDAGVRAHAAWSLGWARFDLDVREACLRDAAQHDSSRDVRDAAAQALEHLAGESGIATGE